MGLRSRMEVPEFLEAKGWSRACEEGGEDGVLSTGTSVASGKKGPIFLPFGRIRWVNREIAGGNEECGSGC